MAQATVEIGISYLLKNVSVVSSLAGARVWDTYMPDNTTFPAVSFQMLAKIHDHTINSRVKLVSKIYQISVWASDKKTVISLADGIMRSLDTFFGVVHVNGSGVPTSIEASARSSLNADDLIIASILFENELDLYEPETKVYHRVQTYRVNFFES